MTNRATRLTAPVHMTRVQPDDLAWTWVEAFAYNAELVLELYIQGRSFDQVADVTGWPVNMIQELARSAGVERSARREYEVAAWRAASRQMLTKLVRTDLLYAWLDGCEVEQLAVKYGTPADIMWEVIAGAIGFRRRGRPDLTLSRSTARESSSVCDDLADDEGIMVPSDFAPGRYRDCSAGQVHVVQSPGRYGNASRQMPPW